MERGGPSWRAVVTNQVEAEEGAGGAERKAFVPPQGCLFPPAHSPFLSWPMYVYIYVCMHAYVCVCVCVCVCVFVLTIHIYIIPVQGTPWRELTPIRNNDVKSQRYLNQFPNTWQPAERLAEQRSQQSPKVSFAVQ